jgi:tripartite ATP-independent transporter DctP family solute receptor
MTVTINRRAAGLAVLALGVGLVAATGAQQASAQSVEMTVATFHPRGGAADVESLFHFKELVEERSGGDIAVNVFFGGTLGGERELVEQLKLGTVDFCLGGWGTIGAYVKDLVPWGVPYLFSEQDQITALMQGEVGDKIRAAFEAEGIVTPGLYYRGNRQLTTNRQIEQPADLEGMNLRLPENPDWIAVWEAFGTVPVPIPSPEIFSALQTGVVDAQENPISSNYNRKLWEVQDYMVMTNHIVDIQFFLLSKSFLDELNDEQRAMVMTAAEDSLTWATQFAADAEAGMVKEMEQNGMTILKPDLKPFQEVALSTLPQFEERWADGVAEEVRRVIGSGG